MKKVFISGASGGIGRVYKYTTNPSVATGDGIRLAYEMGASIKNLSYVQFHPTAFNGANREQFLISEAVRGEGAYLYNYHKERFMDRYDSRLELAPRDVVSRSVIMESRRLGSNNFYLDIRHKLELLSILRSMAKEKGITVIMSLHEIDLAQKISDKIISFRVADF